MTLRELKESISHIDESYDKLEVVIPNNKRSMGPIGTTKVTGIYQGIDWNSGYLIICPEVKMEEAETIKLPSDEEIGEKANLLQNEEYSSTYNEGINEGFYLGVEYMQQILNQNK